MSSLLSRIEQAQPLEAALLVGQMFAPIDVEMHLSQVQEWVDMGKQRLEGAFEPFVAYQRFFYTELAFGPGHDLMASDMVRMDKVIAYRTGGCISLALLFCHIGRALGFDLQGINLPGHHLVRLRLASGRMQFFDPLNGIALKWSELEHQCQALMSDFEEEDAEESSQWTRWLEPASHRETISRLLLNMKSAFIHELKFEQAWQASDMLVQLHPDDPYERRDRGFLSQQLDCHSGALADYRYYISQCPQDPAAMLLKLQLKHYYREPAVLH
ncbi:SirB1 family protein [Bowmanella yangjiangensis]|uniref:Tetratricopeptide repeat protein n=1 Tax=Bowmanella yangjiangensis TaxID=2811230 RepID=A0ABS3CY19_9ALTE|nr:tetratricopeptide repeat protein [Bowmanella yangjiangensis]